MSEEQYSEEQYEDELDEQQELDSDANQSFEDEQSGGGEEDRFEMLEGKLSSLEETNRQLLGLLQGQMKPQQQKVEAPQLSPEQAQAMAQNPGQLAQFIQEQANQASKKIAQASSQTEWDTKAKRDFPLDKDPKFQKAVLSEMQGMIQRGEMSQDAPTLMYRAAQIASLNYKAAGTKQHKASKAPIRATSLPGSGGSSSEGGSTITTRSKVRDDDPRVRFYKMFKENVTKEQMDTFKKNLENDVYTKVEKRKHGRILSR